MNSLFRYLHKSANISGMESKSTVLSSLLWLAGLFLIAIVSSSFFNAKDYIIIFFMVLLTFDTFAIGAAYLYFARSNPDALRSENFSIQKIAIEKGLMGDSTTGLMEAMTNNDVEPKRLISGENVRGERLE